MSTKSIVLLFLFLIVSTSQASRQLWDGGFGGIFGSKPGFDGIPGFPGNEDLMKPTQTCTAKGPCYGKKLTCPAECYKSSNVEKEGYKSTSKSGGCSMDCTEKCIAYC